MTVAPHAHCGREELETAATRTPGRTQTQREPQTAKEAKAAHACREERAGTGVRPGTSRLAQKEFQGVPRSIGRRLGMRGGDAERAERRGTRATAMRTGDQAAAGARRAGAVGQQAARRRSVLLEEDDSASHAQTSYGFVEALRGAHVLYSWMIGSGRSLS